ncbi:MAG: hypothetical protein WCB27_05575 [Thermoguttaceae bacterium]
MNHLPQDELLSAYLDGELTAEEQAEAERLLAASPAARQLLDELWAVSATLQSLPQMKVGEDLSQQVLRVAERRMLTEGEPADAAPAPLSRTLLRRFINRRSMVWLGLTAAIAAMIVIHEQHQKAAPADKNHKEVALVRGERDKAATIVAHDSFRQATIQAAPGATVVSASDGREAKELAVKKRAGKAPRQLQELAMTPKAKGDSQLGAGADFTASPPSEQPPARDTSAMPAKAIPPSATPLATTPPPLPRYLGKMAAAVGKAAPAGKAASAGGKSGPTDSPNWYDGDGAAAIGPDVLLVFCDVSPDATKEKAFDKVLAQNGFVSRERVELKDENQKWGDHYGYVGSAKADGQATLQQHFVAGNIVRRKAVPGKVELVYVEATPEQVKATLAGLAAQPKLFVSVSVKSPQDEAARQLAFHFAKAGDEMKRKSRLSRLAETDKSADKARHQQQRDLPAVAAAKPNDNAVANLGLPAASQKGDLSAAGRRNDREMEATRERSLAKSENKGGENEHGTNGGQSPNATPAFGGYGSPPPVAAQGQAASATPEPQPKAGVATQQVVPAEKADRAAEGEEVLSRGGGQQSKPHARSAPRQHVLFVVRTGGGSPPLASEVASPPADAAKQAPSPPAVAPSPSK